MQTALAQVADTEDMYCIIAQQLKTVFKDSDLCFHAGPLNLTPRQILSWSQEDLIAQALSSDMNKQGTSLYLVAKVLKEIQVVNTKHQLLVSISN